MIFFLTLLFFFISPLLSYSDIIKLKNGNIIEGKILEKTPYCMRVEVEGVVLTYYLEEIENIEGFYEDKANSKDKKIGEIKKESSKDFIKKKSEILNKPSVILEIKNHSTSSSLGKVKVIDDYIKQGSDYLDKYQYKEAIEVLKKAIELEPQEYRAYNGLSLAHYYITDYLKAIEFANKAIELNPNQIYSYIILGWSYIKLDKKNEAFDFFKKALNIEAKVEDPLVKALLYYDLGLFELEWENYSRAIAMFNRVLEIEPKYYLAEELLGWTYFKLKKYNEAFKYYFKALRKNPKDPNIFFGIGFIYGALDDYDEAIKYFKKALQIDANCENCHLYLGIIYYYLNNYKEAEKHLKKAVKLLELKENYEMLKFAYEYLDKVSR